MPLLPPSLDNNTGKQRVLPSDIDSNTTTAGKQRVPPTSNLPTSNPKRQRLVNQYIDLTPLQLNQLDKVIVKKLGMQFIDDKDSNDSVQGVITKIVKHIKSRKLQFQYFDIDKFSEAPKNIKDYEYINVKYAISSCRFIKYKPLIAHLATYVNAESNTYNFGSPLSRTQRKNAFRRQRPRLEWYHKLSHSAN